MFLGRSIYARELSSKRYRWWRRIIKLQRFDNSDVGDTTTLAHCL